MSNAKNLAVALATVDANKKSRESLFVLLVMKISDLYAQYINDCEEMPGYQADASDLWEKLSQFGDNFGRTEENRLAQCCNYFNTAQEGWHAVLKLYNDAEFTG